MRGTPGIRALAAAVLTLVAGLPATTGGDARVANGPAASPALAATDTTHAAFDRLLRATVRDERVDYRAIRASHTEALEAYLGRLARIDPGSLSRAASLAYHLNLYNATMIQAVVERLREGYTVSADDFAVFDAPLVKMRERTISLNALEHERIRPTFGDPRVHAALVCAAVSCPPLDPGAFTAANVESRLERNMRRFVNDPVRNRVDRAKRALALSSIFDWYAEDFGGKNAIAAYVDRYHAADVAGFSVSYRPYDWTLNITPSAR